ncbi:hypothetical protein BDR07DRAFT_1425246 [Suillus spraguei]|nr:hypothetical protein BDR07DRAFT_1425246 [Suillus spraguei]
MVTVLRSSTQSAPVLVAQHLPPSRASNSHMHAASVPMRHIRFAPLPEPTAQVDNSDAVMDTHSPVPFPPSSNVQHNAPSKQKPKSSISHQFNLFKRSSTDPNSQPYDFGVPLSRSESIAIPSSDSQPKYLSTAPSSSQTRSSTNSLGPDGNHHAIPQNLPTGGMHMLNGRVYRSKRQSLTNPFANVRDEPEFVEWGYGGMGSISCCSNSKYSVLAQDTPALLSHGHAQKVVNDSAAREMKDGVDVSDAGGDGDDWSGMGWVRKRRQQKERLARGNTC